MGRSIVSWISYVGVVSVIGGVQVIGSQKIKNGKRELNFIGLVG